MIHFAWPWCFLLLLLPWVVYKFMPRRDVQLPQLDAPTLPYLAPQIQTRSFHTKLNRVLALFGWLFFTITIARPQWLDEPIVQITPSRDIIVAVDVSKSMVIQDMSLEGAISSRIDMVKSYLRSFVQQRKGDRISLIVFADHAYLMVPFTQNTEALKQLISEINVGLAGNFTAIGEAITLSVKKILQEPYQDKTLILISDGRDTVNSISEENAALLAKASGLKIYTIGVGADPLTVDTPSDLDEASLEHIATITGGKYFRARSESDLSEIYQEINLSEALAMHSVVYQPITELYTYPALLLCLCMTLLWWRIRYE